MRTHAKVSAVVVACVIAAALGSGSANALGQTAPSLHPDQAKQGMTDEALGHELQKAQDRLLVVADKLNELIDPLETGETRAIDGNRGYLLHEISPEDNRLDIYWEGPVPQPLTDLLASEPDINVRVHDVSYSQADFMHEQARLFEALRAGDVFGDDVELITFKHLRERAGFRILLRDPSGDLTVEAAESTLSRLTFVPARVELTSDTEIRAGVATTASRWDDSSPWYGGAALRISSGWCTSGLPVKVNGSGNEYITTARHCIVAPAPSAGTVLDGATDTVGVWNRATAGWQFPSYDVTLIEPASSLVGSRLYSEGNTSSASIDPTGASTSTVGQYVCPSGSNSGVHCLSKVEAKNEPWSIEGTVLVANVRAVYNSKPFIANAKGDSGGPVFRLTSDSGYRALGTISGSDPDTEFLCPSGSTVLPGTLCYSSVIYTSAVGLLGEIGSSGAVLK